MEYLVVEIVGKRYLRSSLFISKKEIKGQGHLNISTSASMPLTLHLQVKSLDCPNSIPSHLLKQV